ncbi:MAG: hypothetical protein ABSC54_09515 [Smithellaceae bacterium]|jgi:hypothetical protein
MLTQEQKKQIDESKKIINSFEYFLDHFAQIEDKENKRAINLRLWPSQRDVLPILMESPLLVILKAQQLGLTWLVAAYVLWCSLTNPMFLTVVISVTEDLSIEFLDRIYFIMDRLPAFLVPKIKTRSKQVLEMERVTQTGTKLYSIIKSLPTTEMGAQSKTPNLLVMDESCKNRLASSIFNASYAGVEQAKGQIIVISNSLKEGPGWVWTRDIYVGSMRGLNRFKRIFLPWSAHPKRKPDFKLKALEGGMTQRECDERFPDTEEQAISDRDILGVYYAQQMKQARKDKRITSVPYAEGFEVYTFWDLGLDDSTSIWFVQAIGREFRFIDYYENVGMGFAHYARIMKDKGYVFGDHYMPHDAKQREFGDTEIARSRKETAENLGIYPIIPVKRPKDTQAVLDGIEAVRNILSQCCFDEKKCSLGIDGLENYRSEFDENKMVLKNTPLHNLASHPADAMRTFAMGFAPRAKKKIMSVSDYLDSMGNLASVI